MARTLKFLLSFEPVRRASQVGADGLEGIDLLQTLNLSVHYPYAVLRHKLRFDLASRKAFPEAHLEPTGRLGKHVGEHKPGKPEREQSSRDRQCGEAHRHKRAQCEFEKATAVVFPCGSLFCGGPRGHGRGRLESRGILLDSGGRLWPRR